MKNRQITESCINSENESETTFQPEAEISECTQTERRKVTLTVMQCSLRKKVFILCDIVTLTLAGMYIVRDSLPLYPLFISAVCGLGSERFGS